MKFTLSWLKDHLETSASANEIAVKLTAIGLEVESVEDRAAALKDFIVAEIREAAPHPNANKLQVCRVWDGTEERQIVCGAANARAGLKTMLAREGVFIPGSGITIRKTKIRDVESNGMLCSAEELGLDIPSEGILELPPEALPGSPAAQALGVDDPVIDIAVTPNRADCLSVRGIARDLAAAGLGALKPLSSLSLEPQAPSPVTVTLATPDCPLFIGCRIAGVRNGASPEWMRARLKAIGLRPISALVDVTNYLTHDLARPLHVYDADKLKGNIVVRAAKANERFEALNDKEYAVPEGAIVITDESGVLGLGGIIGGKSTGVEESTVNVFLECALFDPVSIAETGRALELHSDARYRFERGVDPAFVEEGARIAAALIQSLCGGKVSQLTVSGKRSEQNRKITFPPRLVETLGGVSVSDGECRKILESLGFEVDANWSVTPPSWRADVEGSADLVEEILRIKGYDSIPAVSLPKPSGIPQPALKPSQKRVSLARHALAARGMLEACTWSFMSEGKARQFGFKDERLKLLNPISAELDAMRPSLLPNLLDAAARNAARGMADNALFEVGLQFHSPLPEGQRMAASGIRTGQAAAGAEYGFGIYRPLPRGVDAFDAKADALSLLETLGVNPANVVVKPEAPEWYHPGRSGALALGKTVLGYFGEVHPARLEGEGRAAAFEIFPDEIPESRVKTARPAPKLSPYPAVVRDFAFVTDARVTAAEIVKALKSADRERITEVSVFDVYSGKGMEAGRKSVAVQVTLQSFDRTLTEAEITEISNAVIAAAKGFGGALRQS